MPAPLKTEAIVLRSIRYGEADRILHLYTPQHGRIGAIAKGVRRARSRFGARLEPFFHVRSVLHDGRGDLFTVTSVDTVATHASLRDRADTLDAAARCCDAVTRLFETTSPHPEVFTLLSNELAVLSSTPSLAGPANGLAFRLKLLLAAGILPQLGACASCGEPEHLQGFSAAAGGVVCGSCEAAAFPLDEEAYRFLVSARWAGRWRSRRRRRSARCARPSGRSSRPRSTTPRAPAAATGPARVMEPTRGAVRIDLVSDRILQAGYEHPTGPVADAYERRIREREERELSPLATRSYPAARVHPESDCGLRTPFQRDRDRIVHCKAFRRLDAQDPGVRGPDRRPLPHPAHAHARGHTGVADGGRALALNEDLVEAIGLGHDLGHPPFGHIGEEALDRCLRERFGASFLHHEHSLRVVDTLERDGHGLNLNVAVRDGIVSHSGRATEPGRRSRARSCAWSTGSPTSTTTSTTRLRAGRAHRDRPAPASRSRSSASTGPRRIDTLVHDLVEHSERAGDIVQGEVIGGAMSELRVVHVRRACTWGREATREHAKIDLVVRSLFDHYCAHPEEIAGRSRPATSSARHRLPRRDDRPLLHPRVRER